MDPHHEPSTATSPPDPTARRCALGLAAMLIAFGWLMVSHQQPPNRSGRLRTSAWPNAGADLMGIGMDVAISRRIASLEQVPAETRLSALEATAEKIDRFNPQAMQEIMQTLQHRLAFRSRAYAPVTPPPAGEFDADSALIIGAVVVTDAKGAEKIRQTLVDKDGRSIEVDVDKEDAAAAATALNRVKQSPALSELWDRVVLPFIGTKVADTPVNPEPVVPLAK